jgi:hypothetical protein
MARLPKNALEAVEELGVSSGQRVLAFGPAGGFVEALSDAVGAEGMVTVHDPPPDLEAGANVNVLDEVPADATGQTVLVWVGPVPAHAIREYPPRVADGGALWVVLPRKGRDAPAPVNEAEVKRTLLAAGWRDDRTVSLSTDAYAIRFHKRR